MGSSQAGVCLPDPLLVSRTVQPCRSADGETKAPQKMILHFVPASVVIRGPDWGTLSAWLCQVMDAKLNSRECGIYHRHFADASRQRSNFGMAKRFSSRSSMLSKNILVLLQP